MNRLPKLHDNCHDGRLCIMCKPLNDSSVFDDDDVDFGWSHNANGLVSTMMEHGNDNIRAFGHTSRQFIATQGVAFVIHVAGAAVLLDYSTLNSSIQPIIRDSMRRLIWSSSSPESTAVLKMIQENVSVIEWDTNTHTPFPGPCEMWSVCAIRSLKHTVLHAHVSALKCETKSNNTSHNLN